MHVKLTPLQGPPASRKEPNLDTVPTTLFSHCATVARVSDRVRASANELVLGPGLGLGVGLGVGPESLVSR